jgi:1-acyl-sn-glycerol-3-phosphate acyltransferase
MYPLWYQALMHRLWYPPVSTAMNVLFSVRTWGRQRVPMNGGLLVVANHQSFFDPVLIGMAVRRRLFYLARKTLFRNPLFSWLIRSFGAIPIDQEKTEPGGHTHGSGVAASARGCRAVSRRGTHAARADATAETRSGVTDSARSGAGLACCHCRCLRNLAPPFSPADTLSAVVPATLPANWSPPVDCQIGFLSNAVAPAGSSGDCCCGRPAHSLCRLREPSERGHSRTIASGFARPFPSG